MLITRVELENIKSYRRLAVDFRRGTTAIQGSNGAGKTTLVEAIGFALFDHLPYNQMQFVREGEKYGVVTVHLQGNDDRPYTVERRCGAGSRWELFDDEADYKLEQKTDVLDKLHELFGIDRERSLEMLFQSALGVPQGTFTAIFLEPPAKRKSTFNELLQIGDYRTASDYLLNVQRHYKDQMQTQQEEIQRLSFETRDLESWRTSLKELHLLAQQQTEQIARGTQQADKLELRLNELKDQRDELQRLTHRYEQRQQAHEATQQRLNERLGELELASQAQQAVEASRAAYQGYQGAETSLKSLRAQERQRAQLRQRQSDVQSELSKLRGELSGLQTRLDEVESARELLLALIEPVNTQNDLERQREELNQQVARYEEIVKEGKKLAEQQAQHQRTSADLRRRIAEIEPLQASADLLAERTRTLTRLQARQEERPALLLRQSEKREALRKGIERREKVAVLLRKDEESIKRAEARRAEAEQLPGLEHELEQLTAQRHRLEGNLETYQNSRGLSVGGQCPFLKETCLNIEQKGLVSLEAYFDGLLEADGARLVVVTQQQEELEQRYVRVRAYASELEKLEQYVPAQKEHADQLRQLASEITRLEREVAELAQDLEAFKQLGQEIAKAEEAESESREADKQVRSLEGLYSKEQHAEEKRAQLEARLQELRQEEQGLRSSRTQLSQIKEALTALGNPRGQQAHQQAIVADEPLHQRQLAEKEHVRDDAEERLQNLNAELAAYRDLDLRIGEQEAALQACYAGYRTYLQNEQLAQDLPRRQEAHAEATRLAEEAERNLALATRAYQEAAAAFSADELNLVEEQIKHLRGELKTLAAQIHHTEEAIGGFESKIASTELLLIELEAVRQEHQTLDELQQMTEQFRTLIREAGPQVLKAMLADISAEANRIFGEIMGDRSAQLSWQDDYEIILRRQGVNRTLAQLSGGEQMSAALAVRLALLKKLSAINIAFFDEPTQNMDELRRMNLAEQIRRVRGFDQLIVISHDDTFEQGLDSLVRLHKENGETSLLDEESAMAIAEREQVQANAS